MMSELTYMVGATGVICTAVMSVVAYRLALRVRDYENADEIRREAQLDRYKKRLASDQAGPERLSGWFGLTRANFAVMPRVLMQAMPQRWQAEMTDLLDELDKEFTSAPQLDYRVQAVVKGKLAAMPDALTNYRHPKQHVLQAWRQ